ncbi:hypothetical protein AGMMS49938_13670 [Fibrobacterales bacterium]|nr:hypothetical protein AGMMS49938_13670 [Fibrobacterales bacterium]
MRNLFFIALFGILCSTAWSGETISGPSKQNPLPKPLQKAVIPWFVARDSTGDAAFSLNDLKKAIKPDTKRVVFAYFATWCPPCREGTVRLRDAVPLLKENGVQVFLINAGEKDKELVLKWVEKYATKDWTLIFDTFGQITAKYGLAPNDAPMSLPQTLLLDQNLKPLLLLGAEGDDWPQILWE